MITIAIDQSLLDTNVHEINFSELDTVKELRKINPKFMETFDVLKGNDRVHWLQSYPVNSPVEEALIQFTLDEIMPIKLSLTAEAQVRRDMAEEATKGIEIDDPEQEAAWEAKIQEARMKDKERIDSIKSDRSNQYAGNSKSSVGEGLEAIKGLGSKSIEKLHTANIKTVATFNELSEDQLKELLGPLVASKLESKK